MQIREAFQIHDKEVVAFVGGGGKTTAMFQLAAELAGAGKHVVTTTTTRIFAAQTALAPVYVVAEGKAQAVWELEQTLQDFPHVLVIGATQEEGKASGIDSTLISQFLALDAVDVVLVEADGSRMRPFKAPAPHEPVIPATTTLVVPVVGVDAIGAPLDEVHVHRPELVAASAGIPLGTVLDTAHIARVLTDPLGGLQHRPKTARVIPLINKVESAAQLEQARVLAAQLLQSDEIAAVAIGAVKNAQQPILELHRRVAAVILAAGGSMRMRGHTKQLLPWGEATLVRNAVDLAERAGMQTIVVVTGDQADAVQAQVIGTRARVVNNPAWASGRASSVRSGIEALPENVGGALFMNADQPFLTVEVIAELRGRFARTLAPIIVPMYEGKTGSPVLFARALFDELRGLHGEQGGRDLLEKHRTDVRHVPIADTRAAVDLDTPEEYEAALDQATEHPTAVL